MAKLKDHKTFLEDFRRLQPELFSNLELLSEYINRREPILTKCKICGYETTKYPQNLLKGMRCQKCYKVGGDFSQRRTHEEFAKELATKQPTLFSNITFVTEYVKANKTLEVKCNLCGRIRKKNSFDLFSGEQCVCTKPAKTYKGKLTKEEVEDRLSKLLPNYIFSEVDYSKNMKQKVIAACDKGHISSMSLADIFTGTICRLCSDENKRRPDTLLKHLENYPHVKWVGGEYKNSKHKLLFECEYHGLFSSRPDGMIDRNTACPICSRSNIKHYSSKLAERNKEDFILKPCNLYCVYIEDVGYKIGISVTVESRVKAIIRQSGKAVDIVKVLPMNMYDAILNEDLVLRSFPRKTIPPTFAGYTEVLDAPLEDILSFLESKLT